jgi:hypothetical protein
MKQSLCATISAQTTTIENPYGYFINKTQHHHRCCGHRCDSSIRTVGWQELKSTCTCGQTCCDSTCEEIESSLESGWVLLTLTQLTRRITPFCIAVWICTQVSFSTAPDNYEYMSQLIQFASSHRAYTAPGACIALLLLVLITL